LAVRIKLRLRRGEKEKIVVALVNSGYEADTPQLMIPIALAREFDLWPPSENTRELVYETAGGPLRVWFIPRALSVKAVAGDVESREVIVDVAISPFADEPLISDMLAGALEIAVEDFARGLWRFRWEPLGKVRESERRELMS